MPGLHTDCGLGRGLVGENIPHRSIGSVSVIEGSRDYLFSEESAIDIKNCKYKSNNKEYELIFRIHFIIYNVYIL